MTRLTKAQQAERDDAIARLRAMLTPGDKLYCLLRHVSRSGMMRHISILRCTEDGVTDISWLVAPALGMQGADDGGIKISRCGMEMGADLVHRLGRTLYPEGAIHAFHHEFNADGGYAFRHEWL